MIYIFLKILVFFFFVYVTQYQYADKRTFRIIHSTAHSMSRPPVFSIPDIFLKVLPLALNHNKGVLIVLSYIIRNCGLAFCRYINNFVMLMYRPCAITLNAHVTERSRQILTRGIVLPDQPMVYVTRKDIILSVLARKVQPFLSHFFTKLANTEQHYL
jgi:hypothetical protein